MKLVFSSFVEGDIQEVSEWIAKDNPSAALQLVRDLRAEMEAIADHPFAYRLRPEIGPHRRIAIVRRYVILFRVAGDQVVILRVAHGMRNLKTLL